MSVVLMANASSQQLIASASSQPLPVMAAKSCIQFHSAPGGMGLRVPRPTYTRSESGPCATTSFHAATVPCAQHSMEQVIMPGDVLLVRGTAHGITRIGANGGLVGHVVLVFGPPQCVHQGTQEACQLQSIWPEQNIPEMWVIPTVESTRSESGLYRTHTVLFEQSPNNQLMVAGELDMEGCVHTCEHEAVELWQSPADLRSHLRHDLIQEVLKDMVCDTADWSWQTASRAVLHRARAAPRKWEGAEQLFEKLQRYWTKRPICTSIVIGFWQRYLCKLADAMSTQESAGHHDRALDSILKFMPLKADRSLPGDLVGTMREVGWKSLQQLPRLQGML